METVISLQAIDRIDICLDADGDCHIKQHGSADEMDIIIVPVSYMQTLIEGLIAAQKMAMPTFLQSGTGEQQ
ncbi:hypothetical protein D9M72_538700 [compost metagenome]